MKKIIRRPKTKLETLGYNKEEILDMKLDFEKEVNKARNDFNNGITWMLISYKEYLDLAYPNAYPKIKSKGIQK